jgi:hypothetical protein
MVKLTTYLEGCDLMTIHVVATLFGAIMCIYVAQVTSHFQEQCHESCRDPWLIQIATRAALTVLALTFLWQFMYSYDRDWTPWPPALAMNLALDASLMIRAVAVKMRGTRRPHLPVPKGRRAIP